MTRTIPLDYTGDAPIFDFSRRARDFECTAQRALIFLGTAKESDPLHPEGTDFDKLLESSLLRNTSRVTDSLITAKKEVIDDFKKHPTDYPYEVLRSVTFKPVVQGGDSLNIATQLISLEGLYIGILV